jgi:hypothetical protein
MPDCHKKYLFEKNALRRQLPRKNGSRLLELGITQDIGCYRRWCVASRIVMLTLMFLPQRIFDIGISNFLLNPRVLDMHKG